MELLHQISVYSTTRSTANIKGTDSKVMKLTKPVFGMIELNCRNFSSKFRLKAEVDSRSHCTVITHTIFDSAFPANVLHDLQCPVLNFDRSEIDSIEGYFHTMAHFDGQQCPPSIYVADDSCEPVIGQDLLTHLGITVDLSFKFVHQTELDSNTQSVPKPAHSSQPSTESTKTPTDSNEQIPSSVEQLVKQLPNLISKEIGTYPHSQHRIQLTADAVPVAVKMRPIPYAL